VRRIAFALVAALLAIAGDAHEGARRDSRVPLPAMKAERGEACVAPVAEMRRNHMKYLFHQRDLTMHEGIRTPRFSLKHCVDCHASAKTGSVLGKDGFCASCHAYAAVKIDCFECHSPERQARAAAR
jgi:[DsrC]-trisulfide reductase subunit J